MDSYDQRVYQSFRRVQGWFEANLSYLTTGPQEVAKALSTQIDALNGVVARLTEYIAQQETNAAQAMLVSKDERELRREVLSVHMATIAKTARNLRGIVPGIGMLRMPRGNQQTASLITAADVLARKAEVYRSVLVENGLPIDFGEQLTAVAARLKASLDARGLARGARRAASEGVSTEIKLGRRVVETMDATLKRVLLRAPVKWAEWRHVQRVVQRGHTPKEVATGSEVQRTVLGGAPTASGATPTRFEQAATGSEAATIPAQSAPTLVQASPTEVVGSSTVIEKAA